MNIPFARRPLGLGVAFLCAMMITAHAASGPGSQNPGSDPDSAGVPEVVTGVSFTNQFEVPEGLKITCMGGETEPVFTSPDLCHVLVWDDLTYWALSFIDNRGSLAIVAVDPQGEIVGRWDQDGDRYLWKIVVDVDEETVTFSGQAERALTVKWEDLIVP